MLEKEEDEICRINQSFASSIRNSEVDVFQQIDQEPEEAEAGVISFSCTSIPAIDLLEAIGAKKAKYKDEEINPTLDKIFYGEQHHLTIDKGIIVRVPVIIITIVALFRGSSTFKSLVGVTRCSTVDFVLFGLEVVVLLFFSIVNIILLKKNHRTRKGYGYKFVRGDIEWDEAHMVAFGILAFI